jgi:hypothetical protein
MRKCLIQPYGFIGDNLFASSVARKLKEEKQFDQVDFVTSFIQVEQLLLHDPYIDNLIRVPYVTYRPYHGVSVVGYDTQFALSETTKIIPPPQQFQLECGVKLPDAQFEIILDDHLLQQVADYYKPPYIAVMRKDSWQAKSYIFTPEEYIRGIDIPPRGYGGRNRNIDRICNELGQDFKLIEVGLKAGLDSLVAMQSTPAFGLGTILWDAAIIANADYFIGAEGGLANVAAAVHTPSVLTGDFVHQLYGWNGCIKKIERPMLGPRFYWPKDGHIDLNPYFTDDEVIAEMLAIFRNEKVAQDYDYEWTR